MHETAPGKARAVYLDKEPIAHAQILLEETADPDRHFALDADFFDRARGQGSDQPKREPDAQGPATGSAGRVHRRTLSV